MGRDIDWGDPKQTVALRHGGCDESRLNLRHVNRQALLRTLVPQGPQITRHKSLGSPIRGCFPVATDSGDGRNTSQMTPPTLDEVLHSKCRHRCETSDIHGDCVGLWAPFQARVLAPRPSGDDEHICPTDFGNQIARSRPGFGDIVQIEPNRCRDSRMLRRDMAESFDAARRDPDGIPAACQLHGDGGAYAGRCADDDCGTCQVFMSCLANASNQRLATLAFSSGPILSRVRCIALFSLFFGLTRSRNPKVTADFLHEVVGDLTMSRNGGPLIERRIPPP